VNKKLGGPVALSPTKRPIKKISSGRSQVIDPQPDGETSKRKRKPFQRVHTDNGPAPTSRLPSLARSVTDSKMIEIKRESSEVPLSFIPVKRATSIAMCRSGLPQFKHLSRREVDFKALTTSKEAKLKKKEQVEQQLKEAITTLKKPNRGLAVKDYVDANENRSQHGAQRSRSMTR
jgi:DNA replication regulator SLD3